MPKAQLPIFPSEETPISESLSVMQRDDEVTYFCGGLPVFCHQADDIASFKMITAQFCVNHHVLQADIARFFGVSTVSVKRAVKCYRTQGIRGFFKPRKPRAATVLTPAVLEQAQQALCDQVEVTEIAIKLNIKPDTLAKAIRTGRLHQSTQKKTLDPPISCKSERSSADRVALMGVGARDVMGRVAASIGDLDSIAPDFQPALDVPNGGVLFALPALLATGLLKHIEQFFKLPKGYYGLDSLFLLLTFMALARFKSLESLRYSAPGEWGKLLGLDRAPEVRTLREKIRVLTQDDQAKSWSAELCRDWMAAAPEQAATLYVDGHVRVYNGHQTQLPKHHVARQKLCLRATTDYWVNAFDGQPFMVINQVVDPGMIKVIEDMLIPELEARLPASADQTSQATHRYPHKFNIIFDREGYSPDMMARLRDKQIACTTYHKYPSEKWPETEFSECKTTQVNGQIATVKLAERGTCLSNKLWVREVRKLNANGHQTSVLSTNYQIDLSRIATEMFARWSQENYFKYMLEHYALDKLASYSVENITDPTRVVNPVHRQLDKHVRTLQNKLNRTLARFGALSFTSTLDDQENLHLYLQQKAELQDDINQQKDTLAQTKQTRKVTPRHLELKDLPEEQQFKQLSTQTKDLIDPLKMIAYRAETSMANILREHLKHPDEARTLLRTLYQTEVDLLPNQEDQTLTIRLHHLANVMSDNVIEKLCVILNETETLFPRTNLRMIFKIGAK